MSERHIGLSRWVNEVEGPGESSPVSGDVGVKFMASRRRAIFWSSRVAAVLEGATDDCGEPVASMELSGPMLCIKAFNSASCSLCDAMSVSPSLI